MLLLQLLLLQVLILLSVNVYFNFPKMVNDLNTDTYADGNIIDRMSCDITDVSLFLLDDSYYLISLGSTDPLHSGTSSSDCTVDQIRSLLQHQRPAQLRVGSRHSVPRGCLYTYNSI